MPDHPAAVWATEKHFSPSELDCITSVVLKILDGKCKMNQQQRDSLISIYDITKVRQGTLFPAALHALIEEARMDNRERFAGQIHQWRLSAEAAIPKLVMKRFKAMLGQAMERL